MRPPPCAECAVRPGVLRARKGNGARRRAVSAGIALLWILSSPSPVAAASAAPAATPAAAASAPVTPSAAVPVSVQPPMATPPPQPPSIDQPIGWITVFVVVVTGIAIAGAAARSVHDRDL